MRRKTSEITPFQVWSLGLLLIIALFWGPKDEDKFELIKGGNCEPPQYVRKY